MNISHDYPMPKKPDIRCHQGHTARAVCESPILCPKCHTPIVLWVNPPAIKCPAPGKVGIALGVRK